VGASGWHYFVPYQPDVDKALQELRQDVFQRKGKLLQIDPYWKWMTFEELYPFALDLSAAERAAYEAEYERLQALEEPTTIEALLEWNRPDGTGSILDIERVSPTPNFAAVSPVPTEQLRAWFDTDRPSRTMLEQAAQDGWIFDDCERGQGYYFIVFQDGEPSEICFVGVSGD
jgi:hypothetical protein